MCFKLSHKKIYITSIIILIIDIISKLIIKNNFLENQSIIIIKDFFNITYAKNTGVAFSLLSNNKVIIIILTIIILGILLKYIKGKYINKYDQIAYGLILGGAIGNLLDRIIYGYVIDFIDFKIFNYNYPIFNIADTSIVIGVIIIVITSFKRK